MNESAAITAYLWGSWKGRGDMAILLQAPVGACASMLTRRVRCLSLSSFLLLTSFGPNAMEATAAEIIVSWTTVEHQVRPRPGVTRTSKSIRLNLQGGNAVSETRTVTNQRGQTNARSAEGRFRGTMKVSKTVQSSWRVQDSKTLVRTENRPQHVEVMRVMTTSASACQAEITYRLKPGFQEYRMTSIAHRDAVFLSSLSAEQVACRVLSNN